MLRDKGGKEGQGKNVKILKVKRREKGNEIKKEVVEREVNRIKEELINNRNN